MPLFGQLPFLRASSPFRYWDTELSQTNLKHPILEIRRRSLWHVVACLVVCGFGSYDRLIPVPWEE